MAICDDKVNCICRRPLRMKNININIRLGKHMSFIAWNDVDWQLVNKRIARYQRRIYKASKNKEEEKVKILQKKLLRSLDAKLLAVYHVTTENKGKNTAGTEKKLYTTPDQKRSLVNNLCLDGKSYPIHCVWIPKAGKAAKRPLGIPVVLDLAKQALVVLALDPQLEASFEGSSYGFRKGRNCQDAIECIFSALSRNTDKTRAYKYILDADIKSCFDQIDHDYLLAKLNTLPAVEKQIRSWLTAGIMEVYSGNAKSLNIASSTFGTPQGGVISPLLANIALNGLHDHLKKWIATRPYPSNIKKPGLRSREDALQFVRYADDFVLSHPDEYIISEAREECRTWLLKNPKLELSVEKTSIVRSDQGFDYLGFRVMNVKRNGVEIVKIYPSRQSQETFKAKVKIIFKRNKMASSFQLIKMLSPVILGWGNYYKYSEARKVFKALSNYVFQKLRAWAFRRDPRKRRRFNKEKYFPSGGGYYFDGSKHKDNWTLVGTEVDSKSGKLLTKFLPQLNWMKKKRWKKVKKASSVYDYDFTH
jgi:RNA-directed DNA polymerase